jgi:hypothetical protein
MRKHDKQIWGLLLLLLLECDDNESTMMMSW